MTDQEAMRQTLRKFAVAQSDAANAFVSAVSQHVLPAMRAAVGAITNGLHRAAKAAADFEAGLTAEERAKLNQG